ncbi:DUF4174 domain-containing protein [SAR116 cluster bacterium]|nr:DUF4174 domain-containing protein [SAR116 cluster bacterium]
MSVNFAMAEKKSLSNYLWENRLLIISFENGDNIIKNLTNEYIKKNQCQFDDRNLKVIFFENYKNSNYQSPSYIIGNYGFWLIGYDGGVKLFSKDISILKNIFSTIDSMPMRKNEMASKSSKCN